MTSTWIDEEVLALQSSAEWRYRKATEYPGDGRNGKAADQLSKLAAELKQNGGGHAAARFCALQDFLFSGAGPYEDGTDEVLSFWSHYRKGIGFHYHPANAERYLEELIKIASDESPLASYVTGLKKTFGKR